MPVNIKQSNPKDAIGSKKVPYSTLSAPVLAEVGLGMLDGACKYGRHNYRVIGVRASVYYDATLRHLTGWWEGEDCDPDAPIEISHVSKAISSLMVLRDAMINDNWTDDRPPKSPEGWLEELNSKTKDLLEKFPNPVEPYTEKSFSAKKSIDSSPAEDGDFLDKNGLVIAVGDRVTYNPSQVRSNYSGLEGKIVIHNGVPAVSWRPDNKFDFIPLERKNIHWEKVIDKSAEPKVFLDLSGTRITDGDTLVWFFKGKPASTMGTAEIGYYVGKVVQSGSNNFYILNGENPYWKIIND